LSQSANAAKSDVLVTEPAVSTPVKARAKTAAKPVVNKKIVAKSTATATPKAVASKSTPAKSPLAKVIAATPVKPVKQVKTAKAPVVKKVTVDEAVIVPVKVKKTN